MSNNKLQIKNNWKLEIGPLRREARYWKFVIFIVFLVILTTPKVDAATVGLGISPSIIQIEAIPPASITAPITIQNLSDEEAVLQILFKPFKPKDTTENGELSYFTDKDPLPGADPLIFQKVQIMENNHSITSVTVAPQQEKALQIHIGLEAGAPTSDYNFSVIFVSKSTDNPSRNAAQSTAGIATNVLLSVGPLTEPKGLIEEFSAPLFLEHGPVPFTVRIKNTGNKRFSPTGKILIRNMFGQTIGKVDLLPVNILGQSIRAIPDNTQVPNDKDESKPYTLTAIPSPKAFWPEKFLLGGYTATLSLSLGEKGPTYSRQTAFYSFPLAAVAALFIAIALIFVIRQRIRKKKKMPLDKKSKSISY